MLSIADEHRVRQKANEIASEIEKRFARHVVRVRTRFDEDWTGEPLVYFNVVLRDGAAKAGVAERKQGKGSPAGGISGKDIFSQVREAAWNAFDQAEIISGSTVHFRSESEAAAIPDKFWD